MMPRAAILGLFLFAAQGLYAGELLDRIVATVNGHVILQSDWQEEVRYEGFVAGQALQDATSQDRKGALDRLIDQELLREQMAPAELQSASPEEVEKQVAAMKRDYAREHVAQPWDAALVSYHFTQTDIKDHVARELSQLRLVDSHLRPSVQVDDAAIAAYYEDHLAHGVPGGQQVTLQQATPKIRELLTQEKINELLGSWLESLHSQAQIRMFVSDSEEGNGPTQ